MSRLWQRVRAWWSARQPWERLHIVVLVGVCVGIVGHQAALWRWVVEDSAISFAYARHLADGEGLVAQPGAERVEGYSNPTWVALLAVLHLVGFDLFKVVKYVQVLLALATVPPVYLTLREVAGRGTPLALLAVAFLGASSQFAIWGGAGLENGLLNLLVALAIWRATVELRTGGAPWSALLWLLVALTRPEGILYSFVGGLVALITTLAARRSLAPTLAWLGLFFGPWAIYQAWHYWYFAWPLPNTYYAKVEELDPVWWSWERKAWKYPRNFFFTMAQGFFLPVWVFGVLGADRAWRRWLAATTVLVLGVWLQLALDQRFLVPVALGGAWLLAGVALGGRARGAWIGVGLAALAVVGIGEAARFALETELPRVPLPDLAKSAPPYLLAALAVLMPLAGLGTRHWQLRLLTWWLCCAVVFYAVYAQWDWMKGFRWFATATVPGAILFALGVDGLVRTLHDAGGRARRPIDDAGPWSVGAAALALVLLALQLPANIAHTVKIADDPDPAPSGVRVRVRYVERLRDRLHVEEPFVDMDVDLGAHLWWSSFVMMDLAGLIDLPFGHHRFEKPFVREYLFEERRPHYAHVHGAWASMSKMATHPEWRRDYVEVPGYPAGRDKLHIGNHVRRDLILPKGPWPWGDDRRVELANGLVVHGVHVPSEPGVGRKVYLELGVSHPQPKDKPESNFRILAFASDGTTTVSWELPPGYDWVEPRKWKADERFHGKYDLKLPDAMHAGTWDLGLVVLDAAGAVVPPAVVGPGAVIGGEGVDAAPARLARGEFVYPGALVVLEDDALKEAANQDVHAAVAQAEEGDCDAAEQSWFLGRMHRPDDAEWVKNRRERVETAIGRCWAVTGDGLDRQDRIARLVRARRWDRTGEELLDRAVPLAAELHAEGLSARESQDWQSAYRLFSDAVALDVTRSWSRRYAEEARAFRLGIDPESLARKAAAEAQKKAEAEARRVERQKATKAKAKAKAPVSPEAPKP